MATETKKKSNAKNKTTSSKSTKSAAKKQPASKAAPKRAAAPTEEELLRMQESRKNRKRLHDEISGLILFAIGVFLVFTTQLNTTGAFGRALHNALAGLFGSMMYLLPYFLIICAICLFLHKFRHLTVKTFSLLFIIYLMFCSLNAYLYIDMKDLGLGFADLRSNYLASIDGEGAGAVGMEIANLAVKILGKPGLIIFSLTVIVICLLLVINTPVSRQISMMKEKRERKRLLRDARDMEAARQEIEMTALREEAATENKKPIPPKGSVEEAVWRTSDGYKPFSELPTPITETSTAKAPLAGGADLPVFEEGRRPAKEKPKKRFSLFGRSKNEEAFPAAGSREPGTQLSGTQPVHATGVKKEEAWKDQFMNFLNSEDRRAFHDEGGDFSHAKDEIPLPDAGPGLPTVGSINDLFSHPAAASVGIGLDVASAASDAAFSLTQENGASASEPDEATERTSAERLKAAKKENAPTPEDDAEILKEVEQGSKKRNAVYKLPPLRLLHPPKPRKAAAGPQQLQERARLLETTLNNFNVDAHVINVTQGASVTRYEVQPAVGVKVSKITNLADDIALNMRAKSIRIEAPIPGKAAVGIEVENTEASPVLVSELIASKEFQEAKSKISFVVGKDIDGNNIVADLHDMPHLLIAGATGSGKSVCINTIITSLLYKATPDEVRLVLVDPKVVELGNYNGIPHLLIPVVTDPKKAAAALNWACHEMDQRYRVFAEKGVKDLKSYNSLIRTMEPQAETMPEIVIIIDELADLMMTASSQVEDAIMRLAQKARAAGMHLILATQRPSVDVLSGVIRANIPSRIAFSVATQTDSRVILDTGGAEKLLGKGDMLFSPISRNKPLRVQGPFITEEETARLIDFVKKQAESSYSEEVLENIREQQDPAATDKVENPDDELTEEAIAFFLKQKQASVSMLQRRFRIGYNRAARIVDEIERRGIIGPQDGSRGRQVLMTEEEYYGKEEKYAESPAESLGDAELPPLPGEENDTE